MCLLTGAKLANFTLPENKNTFFSPKNLEDEQLRLLVFVVDDLESKRPALISVWSVIFYYQDAHGLMIIPLVDNQQEDFIDYKKFFLLTTGKIPHEKTIKYFNTKFKTKWNNSVILDLFSVNQFIEWITNNQASFSLNTELNQSFYQFFCNSISEKPTKSLSSLDWSQVKSDHFKSDLSLEELTQVLQKLTDSQQLLCEFISP